MSREVRDLAGIEALHQLPRLLKSLAARTGCLLNVAEISRELGLPATTLRRYRTLLATLFLVEELPAWSVNLRKRLVKAPKVHLCDSGLAAHLIGAAVLDPGHRHAGALLETFVVQEILKQSGWHDEHLQFFHFRAHTGEEVDLVVETAGGTIAGIEVKLSATVHPADLKGLRLLREAAGTRFRRGVVLYTGDAVVPLDERITALPMAGLWA